MNLLQEYSMIRTAFYNHEHHLFTGRSGRKLSELFRLKVYVNHDKHLNEIHGEAQERKFAKKVCTDWRVNYYRVNRIMKTARHQYKGWGSVDEGYMNRLKDRIQDMRNKIKGDTE